MTIWQSIFRLTSAQLHIRFCTGQPLNHLLMQLSVSSVLKAGVAMIVSNDYTNNDTKLTKLHGPHKDAVEMLTTFSKLGYAVFHCKNMTYYELTDTIDHITALLPIISYKKFVFVFFGNAVLFEQQKDEDSSGEDGDNSEEDGQDTVDMSGQLYTQEGWTISVAEILDYFSAYEHSKLFIFNFCQALISESSHDKTLTLDDYTKDDNLFVVQSKLSYDQELPASGVWIELLSKAIQNDEDKDIALIINNVSNRLKELQLSQPALKAPQLDSMLKVLVAESATGNV